MDKLSGDYIRGYTAAIRDCEEIVRGAVFDLAHHKKKLTEKRAEDLFKVVLEHRAEIREKQPGFVRYNSITGRFEFFNPDKIMRLWC